MAISAPEILDHIKNTFNNFSEIPIDKKVDSCVDLVESFLLTFCGRHGLKISSPSTLRMCAKDEIKRVANMTDFFKKTDFGRQIKAHLQKVNQKNGNGIVFKTIEKFESS